MGGSHTGGGVLAATEIFLELAVLGMAIVAYAGELFV